LPRARQGAIVHLLGKGGVFMKCLSSLLLLAVAVPLVCVSTLYAECKEGQVDINTATIAQLKTVPGIKDKRAGAIIAGRPYNSVDDLSKVKGVGSKTLEKWREHLCVGKKGAAAPAAASVSKPVVKEKKAEPKEVKEPKEEKDSKESE